MSISNELWQANYDLVLACLEHPFVRGIADGTLERKKFAHYIGQDAFFLEAFARAYSIVAAKAPDWEGFTIFHNLAAGVLKELQLHEAYAKSWHVSFNAGGLDDPWRCHVNLQAVEPTSATRRYTDFLLATAWGSDMGLTTTAMSPCMRLYVFLGQKLAENEIGDHQYANWIRTYSSPDFELLAQQLENLTDRYTSNVPIVHQTYRYAMLCERDFFQAAWES